jgi:hypothetical protein
MWFNLHYGVRKHKVICKAVRSIVQLPEDLNIKFAIRKIPNLKKIRAKDFLEFQGGTIKNRTLKIVTSVRTEQHRYISFSYNSISHNKQ